MLAIHPNARTTPAVRAEIARSSERSGVLAERYGVSTETIRKWRRRGAADCQDHSSRPHKLPWKASEEERAVVCALRRATGFPLDDLTFVVTHFLPHLNRDAVYRILKAEGLGRLPGPSRVVGQFALFGQVSQALTGLTPGGWMGTAGEIGRRLSGPQGMSGWPGTGPTRSSSSDGWPRST